MSLSRLYLTKEAKKEAKKRAADKGMCMVDYFDDLMLGDKRKRGGNDFFF